MGCSKNPLSHKFLLWHDRNPVVVEILATTRMMYLNDHLKFVTRYAGKKLRASL